MKFEQKRMTSASKTKVVTEGFSSEEATANAAQMQKLRAGDLSYHGTAAAGARTQRMTREDLNTERSSAFKQVMNFKNVYK